jgi:hypothetical protein
MRELRGVERQKRNSLQLRKQQYNRRMIRTTSGSGPADGTRPRDNYEEGGCSRDKAIQVVIPVGKP